MNLRTYKTGGANSENDGRKMNGTNKIEKPTSNKITILDFPHKLLSSPEPQTQYETKMRKYVSEFVIENKLTAGGDERINWCSTHNCRAEMGCCEECMNKLQSELFLFSNFDLFFRRSQEDADMQGLPIEDGTQV